MNYPINLLTKSIAVFYKAMLICCVVLLFSCKKNILDKIPLNSYSEELVWKDANLIQTFVNNTYRVVPHGFNYSMANSLSTLTDENNARAFSSANIINAGNITPDALAALDYWNDPQRGFYKVVTRTNIFLSRIGESIIDTAQKSRMTGEMTFLRAYAYFRLISFYGGVPLIKKPFGLTDDFNVPRNTYKECMDFVLAELDKAAGMLPLKHTAVNMGRITKGAALAIKARALLYAASPLNNPSNETSKWQQASDAAKAVIDLNQYALFPDYKTMFLAATIYNPEMIWQRPFNLAIEPENVFVELSQYPNGYGGFAQVHPLQNIVDDYETLNGKLPRNDPSYNPQNPYLNRDPRFYASILYDGAPFKGREVETFLPKGQDSNEGSSQPWNSTQTGYYQRKFLDEAITNPGGTNIGSTPWTFSRFAEVLLNYAEAKLNLGDEPTCREYINKIRSRQSVNMPPVTETGPALVARLQNERRIELSFEDHRWFDVRRWKIAPVVLNIPGKRMAVTKDASGNKIYTVVNFQPRAFTDKNYLVPIPQYEISKNPKLVQNPGY
ncbi:MAG: RagB/SusD family nutrient uptake outer membrane protein [Chitinophagaceae bacterium]